MIRVADSLAHNESSHTKHLTDYTQVQQKHTTHQK